MALLGDLEGVVPLLGTLKDMYRKAQETVIFLSRSPAGEPEGDQFSRDFERWMKVGSGNRASLSMAAFSGEPGGWLLY
jgi:hypothetical protein